jgi:cellulose synthase/poly-beta-1,6-N-acetylglucosamine synthase-like glycosyltransferase
MVIQIMSNLFDQGYLDKQSDCLLIPFFSGANVAFRKAVFEQLGTYDVNCATGEDQDICIRLTASRWQLYFQPKAIVGHKCRYTVKAFLKQWYRYGLHHPYIFRKHSTHKLAIYRKARGKAGGTLYQRLFASRYFPFQAAVFLTSFWLMHILFLVAVVAWAVGVNTVPLVALVAGIAVAAFYLRVDIRPGKPATTCRLMALRYLANLALLAGGIRGGLRSRMLYASPTLDHHIKKTDPKAGLKMQGIETQGTSFSG